MVQVPSGVINIITKASDDPWNLNLNTRFGVHNDQRHGGTVGFNAGKFYSQTNVQYTNIDSYNVKQGDYTTINGNKTWNVEGTPDVHPERAIATDGTCWLLFP